LAANIQPVPRTIEYGEEVKRFLDLLRKLSLDLVIGISIPTEVSTSPYTVLPNDLTIFADTDTNAVTVNLPAGIPGKPYRIVNTGTSGRLVSIVPNGTENLIGANSAFTLNDGEALIVAYSTTKGWY